MQRVRDDQHRKRVAFHGVNRERNAVERNRALGRDKARQLRRRAQHEARHIYRSIVGHVVAHDDGRQAVDMAGDQMTAQFVAEL